MANTKFWWVSRPTRDPNDFDEAIKAFKNVAEGKNWRGDRNLHKKFEEEIAQVKTLNVSRDGSGGRTWGALLRSYGFWYNENNVTLTPASETILANINGERYKQIAHQILNFQIPSAYSEHKKLESGFKIFPFRFILKLLLDRRIQYLEENEIALFVIITKKEDEFESVVKKILQFRKMREADSKELKDRHDLILSHMKIFRPEGRADTSASMTDYFRYIKDIANTFLNNIRYLHEIKYGDSKIWIEESNKDQVSAKLHDYETRHPFSNLYKTSDIAFECHYGVRFDRHKASHKATRPKTRGDKNFNKVQKAVNKIRKTILGIPDINKFIAKVSNETSLSVDLVSNIISENEQQLNLFELGGVDKDFAQNYLEVGSSGEDDAEFEELSREIFRMVGFPTNKESILKPKGRGRFEIDGLITNRTTIKSGILECKSSSTKYTFPNGDCAKMKTEYIPKFNNFQLEGDGYELDFFVYVIGNNFTGFGNFQSIIRDSNLSGSVIVAKDLLKLLDKFVSKQISKKQIWKLLKCNKQITGIDIQHANSLN